MGILSEKTKPLPIFRKGLGLIFLYNSYPFMMSIEVSNSEKSLSSVTSLKEEILHNSSKLPILGYPLLDGRQSAPV